MNIVAENIRTIIDKQAAKKANYTYEQFNAILNGEIEITSADIPRIAQALGVTPNDLFGITPEDEKGE